MKSTLQDTSFVIELIINAFFSSSHEVCLLSEQVAFEIDEEIKHIVDERYELAKRLLSENRDMLEAISRELLDKETIDDKEFEEIMNRVRGERA